MPARNNLGAIAAGLVLIMVASAVWGLVNQQRQMYAEEWLRKTYPTIAPQHQVQSQPPGTEPQKTVLLLGDSRVAEWGLPAIPGWRVVNAGVPGLTSSELVLIAPDALLQYQAQIVVIQAGINELKVIGVREDLYDPLVSLCQSNLLKVAQMATERGAKVIVTTVWPTGPVPWQRSIVWSKRVPEAITGVNRRLTASLTNQPQVRLLDVFVPSFSSPSSPLLPLQPKLRDTLHFTPEFYQELTERLILELSRSF